MKCVFCLIAILSGCATLSKNTSNIELSAVEGLKMGQATAVEIKSSFGVPDQIVSLSDVEEMWVYFDHSAKTHYQRASFVIEKKEHIVQTAAWIPGPSDSVGEKSAVLKYFSSKASFEIRPLPLIAKHEISNEVVYVDSQKGVSVRVNEISHVVSVIGFSMAAATLTPPSQK